MASPDISGGSPIELNFVQQGNQVSLKLPSLKYWNMLVIE
jgi:dextranase